MKSVTGKEFARVLERNGWTLIGINGSRHLFFKTGEKKIVVPIHGSKGLRKGILAKLMKESGIKEGDL